MSQQNRVGKRTARERMAAERERQRRRALRIRQFTIIGVVVVVIAVGVVVGVLVQSNRSKTNIPFAAPKGATGSGQLVIPYGKASAKSTLTIYEDPRCSACGQFEKTEHTTVNKLLSEGKVKIQYHLVQLIDGNLGGNGSLHADNALACAQDAGSSKFHAYHDVLYANQPQESDDAFGSNAKLISYAKKVNGLDTATFAKCVNSGTHISWAKKVNDDFNKSSYHSTPTVLLNGKPIYPSPTGEANASTDPLTPARLTQVVEQADKK